AGRYATTQILTRLIPNPQIRASGSLRDTRRNGFRTAGGELKANEVMASAGSGLRLELPSARRFERRLIEEGATKPGAAASGRNVACAVDGDAYGHAHGAANGVEGLLPDLGKDLLKDFEIARNDGGSRSRSVLGLGLFPRHCASLLRRG